MVAELHALTPDPEPEDTPLSGVLRLPASRSVEDEKRVVLFFIGDRGYTVPAEPDATIGLRALDILQTQGENAAIYFSMKEMLGEDGYRALMNYKGLKSSELLLVMQRVQEIAMGSLEGPKAP